MNQATLCAGAAGPHHQVLCKPFSYGTGSTSTPWYIYGTSELGVREVEKYPRDGVALLCTGQGYYPFPARTRSMFARNIRLCAAALDRKAVRRAP